MLALTQIFLISFLLCFQLNAQSPSSWSGWDEISNIFVFGDSYTATGFLPNETQPNRENPLGNPEFPGRTFSNGRNWIDFLTYNYNDSFVSTFNFARGGASVDSFGLESIFRPFDHQVDRFFLPNYSQNNTNLTTWRSDNTLFTTFFGINDVNFYYKLDNRSDFASMIMGTYDRYVEKLYDAGARNFLFLNVPPIHRAPFTVSEGERFVGLNRGAVEDFNSRITDMAGSLLQRHQDTAIYLFDTYSLYNNVLDSPDSREETRVYSNTTGFCFAYSERTYNEDENKDECDLPQNGYFWLDALHPTPPIHRAMAAEIAAQLRGNEILGPNPPRAPAAEGGVSSLSSSGIGFWSYLLGIAGVTFSMFGSV